MDSVRLKRAVRIVLKDIPHSLRLRVVTGIASTMATDLAAPDCHKRTRVAVGTAPCQDVPIGGLDDGKDVTRALVGHGDDRKNSGKISCDLV